MPELPEVETVKEMLKERLQNRKIVGISIYYPKLIEYPDNQTFEQQIVGESILNLERRGKWILFELDHYYLLSHLRMEGKYVFRNQGDPVDKHEHIAFLLDNGEELRYKDTRKFGRMYLIEKENVWTEKPLSQLGLEPWDNHLDTSYLREKLRQKVIPIKTSLLDQSIIAGIGNIYANEILFLSEMNPMKKSNTLTNKQLDAIIQNTQKVLREAIKQGGTTILSYESREGVHGRFQQNLCVHGKEGEPCPHCNTKIVKTTVGGRGTYYCPKCQK